MKLKPILDQESRATAARLLKEFQFPFLAALVWTCAVAFAAHSYKALDLIANFGKSFALLSFLSGNFVRVAKQRDTTRRFGDIASRLEVVAGQLSSGVKQIVGYTTGGEGFPEYSLDFFVGMGDSKATLTLTTAGEYPLLDLNIRVIDLDDINHLKGEDVLQLLNKGKQFQGKVILPMTANPIAIYDLTKMDRFGLMIQTLGRNGHFNQTIRLARVDGGWKRFILIHAVTKGGNPLKEQKDEGFPDDLVPMSAWAAFSEKSSEVPDAEGGSDTQPD